MKKIKILGAGQTSMVAALILGKNFDVEILEQKDTVNQSHFALLRFGSKAIEEATGIKLQEVEIKKAIFADGKLFNESNIKFDNLYSQKVTGKVQRRSIGDLSTGKRYIPPHDFFNQLYDKSFNLIQHSYPFQENGLPEDFDPESNYYISTMPMMKSINLLNNKPDVKFEFEKVFVVELNLSNCNVHQTIYYPEQNICSPAYRVSIVGDSVKFEISEISMKRYTNLDSENRISFEFDELLSNLYLQFYDGFGILISEEMQQEVLNTCLYQGVDKIVKEQKFGKISPIDEKLRQSIIYSLTKDLGIFSLGRFACWRNIMMDDAVKDTKSIEKMINIQNLSGYETNRLLTSLKK